jgi:hypothetical protein
VYFAGVGAFTRARERDAAVPTGSIGDEKKHLCFVVAELPYAGQP